MFGHCCVCMCIFCRSTVFHIHVFIDKLSKINQNLMFESINAKDSQNPDGSVWSAASKTEPLLIELFLCLGRFYFCWNTDSRQDIFRYEILRSEPWPLQLRLKCHNEGKTNGWWGGQKYRPIQKVYISKYMMLHSCWWHTPVEICQDLGDLVSYSELTHVNLSCCGIMKAYYVFLSIEVKKS